MNPRDLEKKLMEAFRSEADERLGSLFSRLTELENCSDESVKKQILEVVFREAHSLKGAARSVNITPIETLCQKMESIFGALKNAEIDFSSNLFDTLHDATKKIEDFLAAADESGRKQIQDQMVVLEHRLHELLTKPPEVGQNAATATADSLFDQTAGPPPAEAPQMEEESVGETGEASTPIRPTQKSGDETPVHGRPLFSDSVRIPTDKMDAILLKTEELIMVKQIAGQYLIRLKEILEDFPTPRQWQKALDAIAEISDSKSGQSIDDVLMENIDRIRESHLNGCNGINALIQSMEQKNRTVSTMIDDLLEDTRKTTLHPFTTLFGILPRMIREIARDRGKSAELHLSGGEIEIDKRILEGIKDPILHMLRNAVDHGIEFPDIRVSRGKPEKGNVRIRISQIENSRVEVVLSDDGDGIDISAVKAKALNAGIVSKKEIEKLPEGDIVSLIFHSGLSTSSRISEISGRGLGMAIVKDSIEQLGGSVSVSTVSGQGTAFTLRLPVTQATFRGILVKSAGHPFIIPNANVAHVLLTGKESIRTVENRQVISVNRQAVSLVYLHQILDLPKPVSPRDKAQPSGQSDFVNVVVVDKDDDRIAFAVDEVLNEQEVLVKNLGKQLGRVMHISGATVLGSGLVVPVLNINELVKSAGGRTFVATPADIDDLPEEGKKSILIVEDSFTSRTLLKNILEASGYAIETAIDGAEGFSRLKSETFHAVVSDVEMPRMDGIELTRKIRNDHALSEIPVVLITSLDSREDRERGIDAGADAYIVKSSFDQGNLLAVLEKLI